MKAFEYTIKDELGIHARPAGLLVKETSAFLSNIIIKNQNGKEADAKKLFAVMGLGVKQNENITVLINGDDEEKAEDALKIFFKNNL